MFNTTLTKLFFALTILLVFGCKAIDKFTQFELDYNSTVTIPASTVLNLPLNLLTPEIETNSNEEFAVNDTRKDLLESVILIKLDLQILSPSGERFDFLDEVSIFLSATDLPEIKIAEKLNIPDNIGASLSLDLSGNDLQEYVKKDKMNIRINTTTDRALSNDVEIEVQSTFFVDAKILGV